MSFIAVPVQDFLRRRREGIEEAKKAAVTNPNMIVVDPEDDIICDVCNAGVIDDEMSEGVIWVHRNMVYCSTCRRKHA